MKDENENIKWFSVGSIQDFVNEKSTKVVDPYFDWFISSLLANIDNYNCSQYIKTNIVSFVYLLLNPQFQSAVRKIRENLDIPENGFTDINLYNKWKNNFFQAVNDYQKAKKIPLKQNKIITFIEKQSMKLFKGKVSMSTIFQNPEYMFVVVIMKLLRIGNDRNLKLWSSFFYHIIFTFDPKELLDNLYKFDIQDNEFSISEDYFSGIVSLNIQLSLDSTINSIQTIIKKNKDKIQQIIKEMKAKSPKTDLQALEIKRDYALYKNYISFKGTKNKSADNYEGNIRKQDHAFEQTKHLYKFRTEEKMYDYEVDNIVKIINRMKKRIKESFIDKSDTIGNLLTTIESTEPNPYPEFVKNRS